MTPYLDDELGRGMAKLTEAEVKAIRFLFARGELSRNQLALKFLMSEGAIDHILQRRTWRHVG